MPSTIRSKGNEALTRTTWARDHSSGREIQRARPVHGLHRLRMDLDARTATTCTATSSSATARTRPTRSFRSRSTTASTPRISGSGWPPTSRRPAGRLLAIPHNGNLSNGLMFDDVTLTTKKPIDRDYAAAPDALGAALRSDADEGRRRDAPAAVARPTSSPTSSAGTRAASAPKPRRPAMLPREYAREAYKRGLAYEAEARRQPVQVRHGRLDRLPTLARHHPGRQLLRQGRPRSGAIGGSDRFDEVIAGRAADPQGKDIKQYAWQTSASGLAGGLGA